MARRKTKSEQSFYLFDFDDNIMFLQTPVLLRNTKTGKSKSVSTHKFAEIREVIGALGEWADYELFEDTYSRFRDIPADKLRKNQRQYFVADVAKEIAKKTTKWQAPSWPIFQYACEKQRPLAIVTARGHSPETIRAGIRLLYEKQLIKKEPNWLSIYAVGNDDVRQQLRGGADEDEAKRLGVLDAAGKDPTSLYKRIAIRKIVDSSIDDYGPELEHRFGMSDDDPGNVDLIIKAMCECKKKYLDKRFFVINTHHGEWVKLEVFPVDYPVTSRRIREKYFV